MASQAEIDRLRLDPIRRGRIPSRRRDRVLAITLATLTGELNDVILELTANAAENAQRRCERAKTLETEPDRMRTVVGQPACLPTLLYISSGHRRQHLFSINGRAA